METIHYIPILTTALSAAFAFTLYRRWTVRHSPHLWWWAFGITTYGLGTLVESAITLLDVPTEWGSELANSNMSIRTTTVFCSLIPIPVKWPTPSK